MEIKVTKNQNPKQKPKTEDLVFGRFFTDHMFVMDYTEGIGWHNPEIVPFADLSLSPAAMVLHYGQAVFEGLKAYRTEDNRILLFRPEANFARLNVSDERLCIPHLDEEFALMALKKLIQVDESWVPSAPNTSLYIRPFVIATQSALGVHAAHNYKFIIILCPVGPYYKEGLNPVKIWIEDDYVRAVKGGLGFTKATANYAASLKGQEKANAKGYSQVLWLDGVSRKYIEEVGAMNIFFKIAGTVVTPALQGSILPGITRDSVLQLLQKMGIKTQERIIEIAEIFEAHEKGQLEEAFGTGTAAVISPIGEFCWKDKKIVVSNGKTGETAQALYNTLTGIQNGKLPDTFGWVQEVK